MLEDIERLFEPKNKTIRDIKEKIMILIKYLGTKNLIQIK